MTKSNLSELNWTDEQLDAIQKAVEQTYDEWGTKSSLAVDWRESVMNKLIRATKQILPEGVLCWGWDEYDNEWVPCASLGNGTAYVVGGDEYDTIRFVNPDDWVKAPKWAKSRVINAVGDILWAKWSVVEALDEGYLYAEGKDDF